MTNLPAKKRGGSFWGGIFRCGFVGETFQHGKPCKKKNVLKMKHDLKFFQARGDGGMHHNVIMTQIHPQIGKENSVVSTPRNP